jgi:uncharacterized membrane protein
MTPAPPAEDEFRSAALPVFEYDPFEQSLRSRAPLLWWGTLVGPFMLTAAILAGLWLWLGGDYVSRVVGHAAAAFFFFGRFIILSGVKDGVKLSPNELFAMLLYMDMMTASVLAFHAGFLFKLPLLGKQLRQLMEDGRVIMQSNPWMRRATFLAIVAFVTFPLAATGSIGGSIFGRLLGMSRIMTFIGVAIGSLIGCGTMIFGAHLLDAWAIDRNHPIVFWGGVAFVAVVILVLNYRYRKYIAWHKAREAAAAEAAAAAAVASHSDAAGER